MPEEQKQTRTGFTDLFPTDDEQIVNQLICGRTFDLAVEAGGAALHHLHVFDDRAEAGLALGPLLVLQTLQELVVL